MNRESIVTGLFGLGLGLASCSIIIAFTFSRVAKGEELTWTSGTYMISINWVWLSNLFLTCGLGMFIVSAAIPVLKRIKIKTLVTLLPLSAFYLLIAAFDIATTHVLIKSGMGDEVNPIMTMLINTFGVSYALSLNFIVSIFIIVGLIYFTEKFYLFSAVVLPLSVIRGFVVYNNMKLIENYTLNVWFLILENMTVENIPMIILFSLSVVMGTTVALAFPETEGEYAPLSLKGLREFNPLKLKNIVRKKSEDVEEEFIHLSPETEIDQIIDPVEFTLLLERFRIKQEVIESLLKISEEISRKKGLPPDQITLKDIIDELKK